MLSSALRDWGWEYFSLHLRKQKIGLESSSQGWGHQNGPTMVTMAAVDCETWGWLFALLLVSA